MRIGRRSGWRVGAGVGLAISAACADAPAEEAQVEGELVSIQELLDSAWLVEEIEDRGSAEGVRSTLGFRVQTIYGSGGCNRFTGKAGEREGVLEVGPLASTRRMCEPPAMDQEQSYLSALGRVARFRLDRGRGLLFGLDAAGAPLLRLARLEGQA